MIFLEFKFSVREFFFFFLQDITRPTGPADKMDLQYIPSAVNVQVKFDEPEK